MAEPKEEFEFVTNVCGDGITSGDVSYVHGYTGPPKESEALTSDELAAIGLVGVYKKKGDTQFREVRPKSRFPL